ncbi:cation transporter, partial [Acinetobacter baumannii]
ITSNSVTYLANVLIAVSGLLGPWLSYRTVRKIAAGPNERYSYGLGRLETLSSLAVAASMAFSARFILYDTIGRIYFPEPVEGGGIGLFVPAI